MIHIKNYTDFKYIISENNINLDEYYEEEINEDDGLSDKSFVKFLKNNYVYDKFINNINNTELNQHTFWKDIYNYCDRFEKESYILAAFNIDNSDEGRNFWININRLWLKYIKDHNLT